MIFCGLLGFGTIDYRRVQNLTMTAAEYQISKYIGKSVVSSGNTVHLPTVLNTLKGLKTGDELYFISEEDAVNLPGPLQETHDFLVLVIKHNNNGNGNGNESGKSTTTTTKKQTTTTATTAQSAAKARRSP